MNKGLREKILELREQGKTYSQIQKKLQCSKGNIAYVCNPKVREKHLKRQKDNGLIPIRILTKRLSIGKRLPEGVVFEKIGYQQFIDKIGENPKCYLSGTEIDLTKPSTYQIDHIIPVSRSGSHTLNNLNILNSKVNALKGDFLLEELFETMIKILQNNNYTVTKN